MGKIRVKSFSKAKRNTPNQSDHSGGHVKLPVAPKSALHDISGGRIAKTIKKSVTFRSNLTDIVAADDAQKSGLTGAQAEEIENPVCQILQSSLSKRRKKILKKTDRLKEKRKSFLKKLEAFKQKTKEEKEAAKRKATPIIGDTFALMDALEAVAQDIATDTSVPKTGEPQKNVKKKFNAKKRQREIAEGLEYFASGMKPEPMSS